MAKHLTRDQTDFVRFLGIMLITNSHIDSLYPLPQLATGGALGNALFFIISGYCLTRSNACSTISLPVWFLRRIMRIYPSVILVTLFVEILLNQGWRQWTLNDYVSALVWPTQFWFVSALMLFYLFIYFPLRLREPALYLALIALIVFPYAYFYIVTLDLSHYSIEGPSHFKWLFYCIVMLFGGYLGTRTGGIPDGKISHLFSLMVLILLYFALGFLFLHGRFSQYQVVLHVLTMPIIYLTLVLTRTAFVADKIMTHHVIQWVVTTVAGATLEIYLLQYSVYSNSVIQNLSFPVNVVAFAIILLGMSVGLAKISKRLRELCL